MPNKYSIEELLIKVLNDLNDFLPYLILVRGWVPYIYANYIWEDTPLLPLATSDIDLCIIPKEYNGQETISSRTRKLEYGERHVSMDRLVPFVPIVKGENGMREAEIDFITLEDTSKDILNKIIGRGIKVNKL